MTSRDLVRNLLWGLLVATLVITFASAWWARRGRPAELPALGLVPAFELSERGGQRVGSRELAGRPYVVDFFFTRCTLICPTMTARMAKVGGGLVEGREFRRVSISVDPENDTPAALAAFADKFRAPATWWFLTGETKAIHALSREGFRLGVEPETGDPANPIGHSSRFVLVDGAGRIRGYYDAMSVSELAKLEADLLRLVRSSRR